MNISDSMVNIAHVVLLNNVPESDDLSVFTIIESLFGHSRMQSLLSTVLFERLAAKHLMYSEYSSQLTIFRGCH